jgi:hypothetical protein
MRIIIIILVCIFLSSCGKEIMLETQKDGLAITAIINSSFSKLNEKQYKIKGSLIVKNTTNTELYFSNKDLYLVSSKIESRAYQNSITSNVIDFANVSIPANGVLEQKVYWVVETVNEAGVKNIHLELRN